MSTARTAAEWIGKTPDTKVPPHVKLRVYVQFNGVCPKCTRKLIAGKWDCDHIAALVNGGANRESNLQPLCDTPCHSKKTAEDVAEKSRVYRKRASHIGVKRKKGFSMPGSKASGWKRKMDGSVERR